MIDDRNTAALVAMLDDLWDQLPEPDHFHPWTLDAGDGGRQLAVILTAAAVGLGPQAAGDMWDLLASRSQRPDELRFGSWVAVTLWGEIGRCAHGDERPITAVMNLLGRGLAMLQGTADANGRITPPGSIFAPCFDLECVEPNRVESAS